MTIACDFFQRRSRRPGQQLQKLVDELCRSISPSWHSCCCCTVLYSSLVGVALQFLNSLCFDYLVVCLRTLAVQEDTRANMNLPRICVFCCRYCTRCLCDRRLSAQDSHSLLLSDCSDLIRRSVDLQLMLLARRADIFECFFGVCCRRCTSSQPKFFRPLIFELSKLPCCRCVPQWVSDHCDYHHHKCFILLMPSPRDPLMIHHRLFIN